MLKKFISCIENDSVIIWSSFMVIRFQVIQVILKKTNSILSKN